MRAQVLLAAALPWLVGVWLRPDSLWWGVAVLLGIGAFAFLHRDIPRIWALVASGAVGIGGLALDPVPAWYAVAAAATSVAAALLVLLAMRRTSATPTSPAVAAIGWGLVAAGVLTAGLGLLANRASNDQFDAGQASMAAQFDAESSAPGPTASPTSTGSTEGPTSPLVGPTDPSAVPATTPAPSAAAPSVRPPLARLEFRRPGSSEPPVTSAPLYVGPDVTPEGLAAGPGHYPQTPLPGAARQRSDCRTPHGLGFAVPAPRRSRPRRRGRAHHSRWRLLHIRRRSRDGCRPRLAVGARAGSRRHRSEDADPDHVRPTGDR